MILMAANHGMKMGDTNMLMSTNQRMATNRAMKSELIYPELSYQINGVCFETHNEIGCYAKEKQYCDVIEQKLKDKNIFYEREFSIGDSGNYVDFLLNNEIILEVKAKRMVLREDYYQLQRYLQASQVKLGLLVNFRDKYLKPKRIIRIDSKK
jgi:GxxExxY protein